MHIPAEVRSYEIARCWELFVVSPFLLLGLLVFGAVRWWQQAHEGDAVKSELQSLSLNGNDGE